MGQAKTETVGLKAAIALWPRLPCQQYWCLAFARLICAKMLARFMQDKLCPPFSLAISSPNLIKIVNIDIQYRTQGYWSF